MDFRPIHLFCIEVDNNIQIDKEHDIFWNFIHPEKLIVIRSNNKVRKDKKWAGF
jgi:hypothetical protein